jgi:hypothetical protein
MKNKNYQYPFFLLLVVLEKQVSIVKKKIHPGSGKFIPDPEGIKTPDPGSGILMENGQKQEKAAYLLPT